MVPVLSLYVASIVQHGLAYLTQLVIGTSALTVSGVMEVCNRRLMQLEQKWDLVDELSCLIRSSRPPCNRLNCGCFCAVSFLLNVSFPPIYSILFIFSDSLTPALMIYLSYCLIYSSIATYSV